MCQEAKEIQDAWSFEDGDYIFDPGTERAGVWSGYSASDYPGYPTKKNHGGIWLPRQDQLKELSENRWDDYYRIVGSNFEFEDSAEIAGLVYLMEVKYNKKWDGDKWTLQ